MNDSKYKTKKQKKISREIKKSEQIRQLKNINKRAIKRTNNKAYTTKHKATQNQKKTQIQNKTTQ